jgi:hypothetical protein
MHIEFYFDDKTNAALICVNQSHIPRMGEIVILPSDEYDDESFTAKVIHVSWYYERTNKGVVPYVSIELEKIGSLPSLVAEDKTDANRVSPFASTKGG